jgi:hypothetical protein
MLVMAAGSSALEAIQAAGGVRSGTLCSPPTGMRESSMDWLLNFVGRFSDAIATTPWYYQLPVWGVAAILTYVFTRMIRDV